MRNYSEPHSHIRVNIKVVLGLPNYATKNELKNVAGVDTSNLTAKSDFIALKAEVDKLDLNKLSDVVNKEVVTKIKYKNNKSDKKTPYVTT